jgi:hypothetical protein
MPFSFGAATGRARHMQRLPDAVEHAVLQYVLPPCQDRNVLQFPPCQDCNVLLVCTRWARLLKPCRIAWPLACPEITMCATHQQPQLQLWAALWRQTHTLRANPFPLRSPHLHALPALRQRLRRLLPFDVCAMRMQPAPQEAWIWIAPGDHATLWWQRHCRWQGHDSDGDGP